jgi:hypothetical protein
VQLQTFVGYTWEGLISGSFILTFGLSSFVRLIGDVKITFFFCDFLCVWSYSQVTQHLAKDSSSVSPTYLPVTFVVVVVVIVFIGRQKFSFDFFFW